MYFYMNYPHLLYHDAQNHYISIHLVMMMMYYIMFIIIMWSFWFALIRHVSFICILCTFYSLCEMIMMCSRITYKS